MRNIAMPVPKITQAVPRIVAAPICLKTTLRAFTTAWLFTMVATMLSAMAADKKTFPKDFLWGTATSAHQVEGNNTNSDWWNWEITKKVPFPSGAATEHYQRYDEDFALAQSMGSNAYRLSLEWARIEPTEGTWDDAEIQHYRKVLQAAQKRGLKTFLTLHHFTSPQWVAAAGGWENPAVTEWFRNFTAKVTQTLGEYVDYWVTLNEPNVYALTGYVVGVTPPGKKDIKISAKVLANFLKAHAKSYHAIHQLYPAAKVGFAHHMRVFSPANPWNPADQLLASQINGFWNFQILDSIRSGKISLSLPFLFSIQEKVPELKGTLDFIGVNYYSRDFVTLDLGSENKIKVVPPAAGVETNDMGWEIFPEGFFTVLKNLKSYGLPVFITENGVADASDSKRKKFLCDHVFQMARAIESGVDVRGYLHWSLTDNFEWVFGFEPRFGLVAIDYATQKRTLRASGLAYRDIIMSNSIASCE
jgi:beta-glucosidase